MSLATLERAILAEARTVLQRPKLRLKDLQEWCTTEGPVREGAQLDELVCFLPELRVWAAFKK